MNVAQAETEASDPKPAADLWMETTEGQPGASSSSTTEETEAEDSEGTARETTLCMGGLLNTISWYSPE